MVEYLKTPKGYYYKIYKNGKKKRISQKNVLGLKYNKLQIGGNVPPYPLINEGSMESIICYLFDDFEYCGNFDLNKEQVIITGNTTNQGNSVGRLSCEYKKYSTYIWHTHPKIAKYYPSVEDILKIVKHEIILFSFIFTQFGYWILYHNGIYDKWDDPKLKVFLNDCNDRFYWDTNRGKDYNQSAIDNYIRWLDGRFGLNNGFHISWKPY